MSAPPSSTPAAVLGSSLSPAEREFFVPILARLGGSVDLQRISGKGRGLVALRDFNEGEALFLEAPLASMQHAANREAVPQACEHCHRFVGTLASQLGGLTRVHVSGEPYQVSSDDVAELLEQRQVGPSLPAEWVPPALDPSEQELSPLIPCELGCGAVYCSAACQASAARKYHILLCPGVAAAVTAAPGGAQESGGVEEEGEEEEEEEGEHAINAALLFRSQAVATNEIFLLAARVVGRVLEAWVRNGNDMSRALAPLAVLHIAPWAEVYAAQAAGDYRKNQLLDGSCGGAASSSSSSSAAGAGGVTAEDEEQATRTLLQIEQMREWQGDSLTILKALVAERLPLIVDCCAAAAAAGEGTRGGAGTSGAAASSSSSSSAPSRRVLSAEEAATLLSPHAYDRIVAAFELNNVELKIVSPLRDYMEVVYSLPAPHRQHAVQALAPVLSQVAAARFARRAVRRELARMAPKATHAHHEDDDDAMDAEGEEEDGDDGEEEGEEEDDSESDYESDFSEEGDEEAVAHIKQGTARLTSGRLFPHSNGTALFSVISQMNHSCAPNVAVAYSAGNHCAAVIAQGPVKAGEELSINYVDVQSEDAENAEVRRADLAHYGFRCTCPRCGV